MLQPATLADLPAFLCAHAEDARAGTGCTVFIAPDGATCGVDVRGGGPATRETDLLKPENMIQAVHGVVLSGGSAFGLAAATGVMDELAARGIGFPVESARVPIVVGACLFDLLVGQNAHPDAAMGRAAARAAFEREAAEPLAEGNTTIGVVLTNARLTKAQATKASSTVHDAYARAIKPVHTSGDGDTVFTFASGEVEADYDTFAILATEAMQGAVVRAVEQAEGAYGLPAARDLVSC